MLNLNRGGKAEFKWVVLLQLPGPQVRHRLSNQPGHGIWILESHGQGPDGARSENPCPRGDEEDAGFLPQPSPQWHQDRLDHAWVSPWEPSHASQGICFLFDPGKELNYFNFTTNLLLLYIVLTKILICHCSYQEFIFVPPSILHKVKWLIIDNKFCIVCETDFVHIL